MQTKQEISLNIHRIRYSIWASTTFTIPLSYHHSMPSRARTLNNMIEGTERRKSKENMFYNMLGNKNLYILQILFNFAGNFVVK